MKYSTFLCVCFCLFSCQSAETTIASDSDQEKNELAYIEALKTHLNAVSNKDLFTLKATLSPKGDMYLILPQSKMTTTVMEFMDYHKDWFAAPNWSFNTQIIHSAIGTDMGISVVEALYEEPERDGKPYFNKMNVSYALRKMEGKWYIVKDHACSIEKSTDTE